MNACACGALGDPNSICTCTAQKITSHWAKLGRQLIERFDIRLPIRPEGDFLSLVGKPGKPDSYYTGSVEQALARQRGRYKYIEEVDFNGQVHFSTAAPGSPARNSRNPKNRGPDVPEPLPSCPVPSCI